MKKMSNKRAFTLIELLVVVAILSVLLFIALLSYKDTTQLSKIRVFEANSRHLMWELDFYYSDNNGKVDGMYESINSKVTDFNGKPELSSYLIDNTTNQLVCKLDKKAFWGDTDYIIKYDPVSQKIIQEPYGDNGKDLIKGATYMTIK